MGPADDPRGMFHLARSAAGEEITEYHLQAGDRLLPLHGERLLRHGWHQTCRSMTSSWNLTIHLCPLNRAIVIANLHGPGKRAWDAVATYAAWKNLDTYYLLHAVLWRIRDPS